MTAAPSHPAPRPDLSAIPDATRAEAERLDEERQAEWRAYSGPARRFEWLPAVMALESRARDLLHEISEQLLGDWDALIETRETLAEDICCVEALAVLCDGHDPDVLRWLAAAAEYAREAQS